MKRIATAGNLLISQVLLGLGSYAFLVASADTLPPEQFAAFAVFWSLAFSFGLGLFGPLEVLLLRLTAQHPRPQTEITRLRKWFAVVAPIAATLAAIFIYWRFGDSAGMPLLMTASTFAYLFVLRTLATQRGEAAGQGDYARYARQVGADGAARVVLALLLAFVGASSAGEWTAGVLVCGVVGALVAAHWRRRDQASAQPAASADGSAPARQTLRDVLILAGGTTVSIILANSLPALAALLGLGGAALAAFSAATLVARVPIFFSGLGSVVLVPRFASLRGDVVGIRTLTFRLLSALTVICALITVTIGWLSAPVLKLLFNTPQPPSSTVIWLLALSTGTLLFALIAQSMPIGLGQTQYVAYTWLTALGIGALVALTPGVDIATRVALASAASGLGAVVAILVAIRLVMPSAAPVNDNTAR